MKKVFYKIHLWLSIPFGLIICIICISGASLVFEDEFMELCYPDRYFVKEVKDQSISIEELLENVNKTLPDSVSVTNVSIFADMERAYQIGLSKPRRASVYVDQYTGEVKPRFERAGFFSFMFRLHRWLLDSMKPDGGIFWGKMIVGISTLIFVFVLITGIVIWFPRSYRSLKRRLKISVNKGWKRFWYDLHIAGGMYVVIILLALALTGLTWSFPWYRSAFYKVFGVEVQQQSPHGQNQQKRGENIVRNQIQEGNNKKPDSQHERGERRGKGESSGRSDRDEREGRPNNQDHDNQITENIELGNESILQSEYFFWQPIYGQLSKENPDYEKITVSANSANVSFNRLGNQRASDRYSYDSETGKITDVSLYKDQENANKIRGWIYSVHVGSWGGWFTRIITFLAALIGGTLPLTGYYFWIRYLKRKKLKKRES